MPLRCIRALIVVGEKIIIIKKLIISARSFSVLTPADFHQQREIYLYVRVEEDLVETKYVSSDSMPTSTDW